MQDGDRQLFAPQQPYEHWQGANWRRLCRVITIALFLLLIVFSWVADTPSALQVAGAGLFAAVVFVLSEWFFARKMGVEIDPEGLVLCGPLRRINIPWSTIQGVRWIEVRRPLSKVKHLYVESDQRRPHRIPGDAPIRVPTIAFAGESPLPNDRILGRFLTSSEIRSTTGDEADALMTIESAWSAYKERVH